ncbi:MAG TPA: GTP-binding protein [Peptococcaceae bacterium]|nr:GTP-binding protein [Peptococcaceae bacterium]
MTELLLLTGFLGAGKTTLLNRLLEEQTVKTGVIVNEFSQTGVDGQLLKAPRGIDLVELNNGSIFCACIKDNFVDALIQLSDAGLDRLFIEASGLADPASFATILEGIRPHIQQPYHYLGSVCLVDALYFPRYFKLLPALRRQLEYSQAVLINKTDLADEPQLELCRGLIRETAPEAYLCETRYAQVPYDQLVREMARRSSTSRDAQTSSNTESTRPKTVTLSTMEAITPEQLAQFLQEIAPHTYRIKGFVLTTDGLYLVSGTGLVLTNSPARQWEGQSTTSLVIISSVGLSIVSRVLEAAQKVYATPVNLR